MMTEVRNGNISKIIVYKLDRISRSLYDFVNILKTFKENGVEFVSSQESFDTSSPYGELIVKILMVFAEFERTSIINRITQAYAHRSEMGFYMGGQQPYGFELVPTVINNIKTKKLSPIPEEIEHIKYIYEVYSQNNISLRRLMDNLIATGIKPTRGTGWSTPKLSTIIKNPIYAKSDIDIYEYYERHNTNIVSDTELFTGEYGAQLYGKTKLDYDNKDWSAMKLVLMTHEGIIDSETWLKCQKKLEKNKQISNSMSNKTSWLAGKIICDKCGYTMTTIKGSADKNKNNEIRRYFTCTGKSHKRICTGIKVPVYAENLEDMIYDSITEKLDMIIPKGTVKKMANKNSPSNGLETNAINDVKIKIKEIETAEKRLIDSIMNQNLNDDLLSLANQKAAQLKIEKNQLYDKIEELKTREKEISVAVNLAKKWQSANYNEKQAVAELMIDKIVVYENGDVNIIWNI
jgi:DNA invertase Pin-like site-specific DNA recombinase